MWKLSLKNVFANRRRLIGTCSAVVLGVAFLAGTLVLGDTMRNAFDDIFSTANSGTDVVVRSSELIGDQGQQRGTVSLSLADDIAKIPGVAKVEPSISGFAQAVGSDGEPVGGGQGPPTLAGNWVTDEAVNPFKIYQGRAPKSGDEVVVDRKTAQTGKLQVGDDITVLAPDAIPMKLVGIAKFGDADSLGGATYVLFQTDRAIELLGKSGQVTSLLVSASSGVSNDELASRVRAEVGSSSSSIQVLTGEQLTEEQVSEIGDAFLTFLETILVVFSGVAMLVATFSIYNTFSVVLAQRTRESALLRALGASRGQVIRATVLEAALIGLLSGAVGMIAGVGLARLLIGALGAAGLSLPSTGLVVHPDSLWIAGLIGLVVTVLAGLGPAIGSSRVPPLAALRDVAIERVGMRRWRLVFGSVLLVGGLIVTVGSALRWFEAAAGLVGIAAGAVLIGFVVLSPLVAAPVASAVGRPIAALRGTTGRLARENAIRNPRRTAGTATALMIGVGVVSLFMVFAASIKVSVEDAVAKSLRADLVVQPEGVPSAGLPEQLAPQAAELPNVSSAVALFGGAVRFDGKQNDVTVADVASVSKVLDVGVTAGQLSGAADTIAVSSDKAKANRWKVGSTVEVTYVDGASATFTVGAIYTDDELAGQVLFPQEAFEPHATRTYIAAVLINARDGASISSVQRAVNAIGSEVGAPKALTRAEFVDKTAGQIDQVLALVYVMLTLSIIIALMGIANTMSLSVFERLRELGLLRAVGQARGQTRAMVRWESVIISLFGTASGVLIGTLLSWVLLRATESVTTIGGFALPVGQLLVVLFVGAFVGVLAGLRPAFRAARTNILDAIAAT